MIRYWVAIYMPTKDSYNFAGFTTSQISHTLADVQKKTFANDQEVLQVFNDIRSHDVFAAVVPMHMGGSFAHQFLNYATSAEHKANLGVAIRAYRDDVTVERGVNMNNPKPVHDTTTFSVRSIATLKLFKSEFLTFTATAGETYTVSFKETGGDKMIIGPEGDLPAEVHGSFETDVR